MTTATDAIAQTYERDGFVFPIDVLSTAQASEALEDLQAAEAQLEDDAEKLSILRSYPDRVLPSFDALVRHPALVAAANEVLGPDLMVWSAGLFMKDANSQHIVTWHQDLTYWGLDDAEETTAWLALSPAKVESGCMQFVPGSHKRQAVPHVDTFAEDNLLSRGQEIAVEVEDGEGVPVELEAGQASMHHGHLFHSSGPNRSNYRRVGTAIRYIKTSMKQRTGDRSLVAHVSGTDNFNHFSIAGKPRGRLHEDDFDLCRQDMQIKRKILYEGMETARGQRY